MDIEAIRKASRLIFVDELTGLYNRRFLRQYLGERLDELAQRNTPLSVIMLDLDGFKQINDTYGHLEGDLILKRLAQLLRDTLPPDGLAIRFAGDEFFAFLEGVGGDGGMRVAEGIRERVSAERFISQKAQTEIPIRISVGVASFPEDAATAPALIEAADQALYRSKRMGKNCVSRAGGWALPPEVEVLKRFPCPRVAGRQAELEELERPFLDGTNRGNRFFLVEADRGLGKSRLLAEVKQHAGRRGLRCFFQRCLDSHRAIPYSSLTPILTECFTREPGQLHSVRERLSGPTVTELGTIIPGLATSEGAEEPVDPEERRSLLFHGMGDLLCLLSEQAPLLLFLDDLHFVDEASLEVLSRLLDQEEGQVVVYGAAKSDGLALGEGAPLALPRLSDRLGQSPNFLRLNLSALTIAEVAQMITEILQHHTPSRDFVQRLYEGSRGIPLFVEETLRGLIVQGALKASAGVWNLDAVAPAAVPASLEAAVLGGLEALDPETHDMISKAAIVGPHVNVTLLAGVLGKDPGETLELVDRGKKSRVFEEPGPLGDQEEVRFLSQCFQQIVYSHQDQDNRRRTHRVVGEVTERLAGERVVTVLGPLAYHFERSDDAAKAEFYRQQVRELQGNLFSATEVESELSLEVGADRPTLPLDAETFPLAERFLRALTVAVKNMRVYPEGSRLVQDGVAEATAILRELLARVGVITFAEEGQAFQINSQPVESKGLLPVVQDLLRVYAEHGVRRCTFEPGATDADLMGLLRILSRPSPGIQHSIRGWQRRLQSEGSAHVRVFPVIYLATREGKILRRLEPKESPLDEVTLTHVRDVLRSLAAAVDNIRLYPPESELITLTLDQLERQARALFARIPNLTVGMAEETIVINATRPNPRLFGITIEVLQKLMDDNGLTSLTIRRGVSREELRLFLTELAQPPTETNRAPAFWQSLLEGRGIAAIEVGTRRYVAAAPRLEEAKRPQSGLSTSGGPRESSPQELSEVEQLLGRAAQWLKEPLRSFLERAVQEEIPPVLGALRRLAREDVARQLVERTAGALGESEGSFRRKAAQDLVLSLRSVEAQSVDWLVDQILDPLGAAVKKETQLDAFQVEVEVVGETLKRLLLGGDLSRAARLAEAVGGTPPGRRDPERFVAAVRGLVDSLAAAGAFQPVWKALKDADPAHRQQGSAVLAGLGAGAAQFLLQLVLRGEGEEITRVAAELLRAQGDASIRLLTQELPAGGSVERACRIVSMLDVLAPSLGSEFLFLLGHPEVEVRAEMARTLSRIGREHAMRFLGEALEQPKSELMLGALECVRGLRGIELLDAVLRLLATPPNEHVLRAACLCLGRLNDKRAVDPLLRVLERRPRFFGLVKGLPEGIRATAARALGELAFVEARKGLEVALKDRDKTVRSAARLALLRVQQELERKPRK
ncbi:MAG: diguanylate cyclase [Candidatus Rokubacteria bacterium]|nr:diguanylate cyclase [Candidatus Rokubacteria bacterium]